jgi:hypothetical protein
VLTTKARVHTGPTAARQRRAGSGTGARLLVALLVGLVTAPFTAPFSACSLAVLMASHDRAVHASAPYLPTVVTANHVRATGDTGAVLLEEQLKDGAVVQMPYGVTLSGSVNGSRPAPLTSPLGSSRSTPVLRL